MKLTKSKLKQLIKEELNHIKEELLNEFGEEEEGELEEWEPESEYKAGDFVEIKISDDGYDKSIEKLENPAAFTPTHGTYTSEKFLAKIIQVSKRKYED